MSLSKYVEHMSCPDSSLVRESNDTGRIYSSSKGDTKEQQQHQPLQQQQQQGRQLISKSKLSSVDSDCDVDDQHSRICNKCIFNDVKLATYSDSAIRDDNSTKNWSDKLDENNPVGNYHCNQASLTNLTNLILHENRIKGLEQVGKVSECISNCLPNVCSTGSHYCSWCSMVRPLSCDCSGSSIEGSRRLSEDFRENQPSRKDNKVEKKMEFNDEKTGELNQQLFSDLLAKPLSSHEVDLNLARSQQREHQNSSGLCPCDNGTKQRPVDNETINNANQVNELGQKIGNICRLQTRDLGDFFRSESKLFTHNNTDQEAVYKKNLYSKSNQARQQQQQQLAANSSVDGGGKREKILGGSNKWEDMCLENIARRYDEMPIQHRGRFWSNTRSSGLCKLLCSTLPSLFPILTSFRDYSLPSDLLTDLMAGFTIAILHIPQGMAYGMLAGVEPIYGLYVSFIPVLVMAFMSRSKHVSYGTFAVISVLLSQATESAKQALRVKYHISPSGQQLSRQSITGSSDPFLTVGGEDETARILTNNHQPTILPQRVLKNLLIPPQEIAPILSYDNSIENALSTSYVDQPSQSFEMPTNMEILTSICILVGIIQILMAVFRLGVLSLMFSDQLVSSFTTGSAIHVVTSQLGGLFDITMPQASDGLFKICRIWYTFAEKLLEGFNQYTAILSLLTIIFLTLIKDVAEPLLRRRFKSFTCLPAELILMAFLIFSSWQWNLMETYDIKVIGQIPTELPSPYVPRFDLATLVIPDAITVALVCFAMNLSLAQVYAKKFKYTLDPNHELLALGTANVVGSFFSCYPCASSLSRSAVQSRLNVKSQISSLFSCALVVLIICYFAPILHDLPKSTLSCIIIVALKGILVQISDLYENWRLSKLDALVWMITFVSVILIGVTYGLVLGIIASLFMVFFRLLTPNHSILGNIPGTEIYVDKEAFADAKEVDRVRIFRFNSPLCYLNRTMFKSCIEEVLPSIYRDETRLLISPNKCIKNLNVNKVRYLIIDCSALAYCDYSGAATLIDIVEELEQQKVLVFLATCPLKLITMIEKMKKPAILKQIYPSITDALNQVR